MAIVNIVKSLKYLRKQIDYVNYIIIIYDMFNKFLLGCWTKKIIYF
jgi:hypothetical protein